MATRAAPAAAPAAALARCTERDWPVRYRGGPDRPCPQHQADDHD
jgi:hypothetical protein